MLHGVINKGRLFALSLLLALPHLAFGQTSSFNSVTLAFPHMAVGGDPAGSHYVTIVQIVNNNSISTTGHFDVLAGDGTGLPLLVDGSGPQSSFDIALAPGETRQIELTSNDALASGWLKATYTPSVALTAVLAQYRNGPSLLSEVGIDGVFNTILNTDLVFENDAQLNNGIAISNPSGANAYVLARLWRADTGALNAGVIISLPPNGHIARLVTELFSSVPNIAQQRAELTLDSCSNSACSSAGGNGFVATALRLNGDQLTSISVVERFSKDGQVHMLPQVAFGGPTNGQNMKTVLYFTTDEPNGVTGAIDLFDNNGNPLTASADGGAPSSSIVFAVQSNRVTRVVLSGDDTLRSGWARVTLPTTLNLSINAVFQTFNTATLVSEASVLESALVQRGLIYARFQPNTNVGVAFANPSTDPKTISLDLYDQQGILVARHDVALAANGHVARFITDLFPEIAGLSQFNGSLAMHSTGTFSSLALRLTGDKLATLPIASDGMHRPAISALRVTGKVNNPAQVLFSVDLSDLDADISTSASSPVLGLGNLVFSNGVGVGGISLDGTPILNAASGTLSGTFQPSNVTGPVPAGTQAVFYLLIYDSLGNASNVVSIPVTF